MVVNPTMLFMGYILEQMKVRGIQDVARGLFICSLFVEVFVISRFCVNLVSTTFETIGS